MIVRGVGRASNRAIRVYITRQHYRNARETRSAILCRCAPEVAIIIIIIISHTKKGAEDEKKKKKKKKKDESTVLSRYTLDKVLKR